MAGNPSRVCFLCNRNLGWSGSESFGRTFYLTVSTIARTASRQNCAERIVGRVPPENSSRQELRWERWNADSGTAAPKAPRGSGYLVTRAVPRCSPRLCSIQNGVQEQQDLDHATANFATPPATSSRNAPAPARSACLNSYPDQLRTTKRRKGLSRMPAHCKKGQRSRNDAPAIPLQVAPISWPKRSPDNQAYGRSVSSTRRPDPVVGRSPRRTRPGERWRQRTNGVPGTRANASREAHQHEQHGQHEADNLFHRHA